MNQNHGFTRTMALLAALSPIGIAAAQQTSSSVAKAPLTPSTSQTAAQDKADLDKIIHAPAPTREQMKEIGKYLRKHTVTRKVGKEAHFRERGHSHLGK